ncbi:SMP-30/gluconolactonase/LRE family protein [Sphingomonas sp. CGMCC 1.13654]|uniref:Regucalcin n=1 Tax=Sphingomonas chungangi TaxID=2683589 RepID=A0A838L4H6_9SPHN|nr:SMP-30/gluconolactonase/LRE family protein [Sphingomonas chungangi]MBA2933927.1 SMP-30/gluconolactonase/LRE family protein [Sphingomonas chungangi]MVW57055.1 SMP-30/gluconolactonase/LRE family protein [Sphingomonas chungangi]
MGDGKDWTCLWEAKAILGESTIWDPRDGCIYWVDIDAPSVNWFDLASGDRGSWVSPQWISAIALREKGGFIASCREGLAIIDPKGGTYQAFADPIPDRRIARLNDGVTDRKGRYWTGSCDSSQWDDSTTAEDKESSLKDFDKRSTGELYRLDADGSIHTMERNIVTANGPAFSPDGKTAYVNDSMPLVTWVYDLAEDGTLSNRRDFLTFKPEDGYPDGMAVDVEGCIWMAFYESWVLRRFAPDASLVEERQLPVRRGLRPAFGGEAMDRLFLITGSAGYTDEMWQREPLAGGLFELHNPGTRGLPVIPFPG